MKKVSFLLVFFLMSAVPVVSHAEMFDGARAILFGKVKYAEVCESVKPPLIIETNRAGANPGEWPTTPPETWPIGAFINSTNPNNGWPSLISVSNGVGSAGAFFVFNPSNTEAALSVESDGSGKALSARNTGTGTAGKFETDNPSNSADVLGAWTAGMGVVAHFNASNPSRTEPVLKVEGGNGPAATFYGNVDINGNTNVYGNLSLSGYINSSTGPAVIIGEDLHVSGNLSKGSGTFVQPHPTDPSREFAYAFFEGPEHAIFLRGTARLENGKALIQTPDHFRMIAGNEGITVQFTPRSLESKGLAAYDVTKDSIKVGELANGTGTYEFDYFITAKRAGFEAFEPVQANTHFTADGKRKEEFERTYSRDEMTMRVMRALLISNGILNADGTLNMDTAKKLGWNVNENNFYAEQK